MKGMIRGGTFGVRGFYEFVHYFVTERGVSLGLFKEKVDVLRDAICPVRSVLRVLHHQVILIPKKSSNMSIIRIHGLLRL
ncbi:hypothetical protein BDZ89DRAFT_1059734 [Hymenopellis radicata]|nr:hypothetical protein BDZ89DRAFT_1059734 [Hymenopellis radicata]